MTHHVWDERHVEIQDRQNELDAVRAARRRTEELLAEADLVLDLGSGTGTGAAQLACFAVAVDMSPVMVDTSANRGVSTCQARVEALPMKSHSVGGVRCDRILYHLEQPRQALAEAVRVTRRGGRIVCTHPDHESMVIGLPGAPDHLVALTKWSRIELNYLNGKVPRRIPEMLLALGCTDVHTEAYTGVVEDPDAPEYALAHWLRSWRNKGAIEVSDDELAAWDDAFERSRRHRGFFFSLTYLLTYGTVA